MNKHKLSSNPAPEHPKDGEAEGVRLQLILARSGLASRRAAADMILSGRVTVNGRPAKVPGQRVVPGADIIELDGNPVSGSPIEKLTIAYNKPRGQICSRNATRKKSYTHVYETSELIYDHLPKEFQHLQTAGRLDKDSEGLIILTNDGELAQQLTHPRFEHRKEYEVAVRGHVDPETLKRLGRPIVINGRKTQPADIRLAPRKQSGQTVMRVALHEGRNRQIRRIFAREKIRILRLKRVRIGAFSLPRLEPGSYKELTAKEINALTDAPAESLSSDKGRKTRTKGKHGMDSGRYPELRTQRENTLPSRNKPQG